ncbi:hypothetical protein [Streptomyces sp. NPDC006274]
MSPLRWCAAALLVGGVALAPLADRRRNGGPVRQEPPTAGRV